MKADTTRATFRRERRYNLVIQQQGRVPLDADWNEQAEIVEHRNTTEMLDVVGQAGFPAGASFALGVTPDQADLTIDDGRAYVDGILCENENSHVEVLAFPANTQITLRTLVIDGVPLRAGEWVFVSETSPPPAADRFRIQAIDPSTQTLTLTVAFPGDLAHPEKYFLKRLISYVIQPGLYFPDFVDVPIAPALPALKLADGSFLAHLSVCHLHVTALQDPWLREVALGGADTCTRSKTVWQVKLAPLEAAPPADCTTPLPKEKSSGRLSARARQPTTGDTPCIVSPTALYRSLENQHYRVEIHDAGFLDTATFKFSRDNGMVMVSWLAQNGPELTLSSLGRDKVLGFAAGQWIELLDDTLDELGAPGTIARIKQVDPTTNVVTLDATTVYPSVGGRGFDRAKFPANPRVRRWDHVSTTPVLGVERPAGDGFLDLEQGVQIRFEDGWYETGDYWLIPARTITADVEWPRNEVGDPQPQLRKGIQRHFARLGIVTVAGGKIASVTDCRPQFPPLTGLPAGSQGCCCGLSINPGDDVQAMIDAALAKSGGALVTGLNIEFGAGTFNLDNPIRIAPPQGGGNLVVRGCGKTTRFSAPRSESVLRIIGWESATITDFYAEAGESGEGAGHQDLPDVEPPDADPGRRLVGVVDMRNCGEARIERLDLECAGGLRRQASCLFVSNGPDTEGVSWVKDCRLSVGLLQVGALLVNQLRTTVTDNFVNGLQPPLKVSEQVINPDFKSVAWAGILMAGQSGYDLRISNNTITGVLNGIHLGFSQNAPQDGAAVRAQRIQVIGNSVLLQVPRELANGSHRGIAVGNAASVAIKQNHVRVVSQVRLERTHGISVSSVMGPVVQVSENDVSGATVGIHVAPLPGAPGMLWQVMNNATFHCSAGVDVSPHVFQAGNVS